jgi:site-specific DNA-methyltransferase (adenine-specific)
VVIADTLAELVVPIDSVRAYGRNPRRGDVAAIRRSLEVNGQYRPIVVNRRTGEVLAGNHTWAAARELEWTAIAATFVDVDEQEAARIVLADNKTAELGGYDDAELAALLRSLPDGLDGTAWQDRELERLLARIERDGVDAGRDTEPGPRPARPRSKPGTLYALGAHRLLCGDATDPVAALRLLDGDQAEMVWTDPPYGVAYQVSLTDPAYARRRRQDGKVVPGDALAEADHAAMLDAALRATLEVCAPGAPWYVTAPAGPREFTFASVLNGLGVLRETLVWVKDAFVFGRQDYHWQHEPILYGWKPGAAHYWNAGRAEATVLDGELELGDLDKRQLVALVRQLQNERQTTVIREDRPRRSDLHPTMKPVGLVARCVLNSSRQAGVVFDPFAGSGTTLIACENLGRRGRALELDPGYCDVIVDRWQRHTGEQATRL